MHKSREIHQKTALRILTYIKGSLDKELLYKNHEHLRIEAFSDSNYTVDKRDRKSTYGYYTYVGGFTLRSNKQSVVSRSSTQVEYRVWLIQRMR